MKQEMGGFSPEAELDPEAAAEKRMEDMLAAADEVLRYADEPGSFDRQIRTIVSYLDKPELSAEAQGYLVHLSDLVKAKLDSAQPYADADIEAVLKTLLTQKYLSE